MEDAFMQGDRKVEHETIDYIKNQKIRQHSFEVNEHIGMKQQLKMAGANHTRPSLSGVNS